MNSNRPTYESRDAQWRRGIDPQTLHAPSRLSTPTASSLKSTGAGVSRSMLMKLAEVMFKTLIFIAAMAYVVFGIVAMYDIPEIHFSYSTGKCVRVVSSDPKHTCDHLPERAETVWVQ